MGISNYLFLPNSENPFWFSVWFVFAKLSASQQNYSYSKISAVPIQSCTANAY